MKLIEKYEVKGDMKELLNAFYKSIVNALSGNKRFYIALFWDNKKRSVPQNKYYWGVIIKMLCDLTGHEKDEIHEYLCNKFIGADKSMYLFGEMIKVRPKSSILKTSEFKEYCKKIREWAYDKFGEHCDIPDESGLPTSTIMELNM